MDYESLSVALGITAAAIQLLGYVIYVRRANGHINTGSWSIWALGGVIDLVSYIAITQDWVVNVLPTACALAAIAVFLWALIRRRFSWPDKTDWGFVAMDGGISVVWAFTNAFLANILFQISTVLSFIPMWRGQIGNRESEDPIAWFIWAGSYSLLTAAVVLRFDRWEELAYPVSHIATHLAVALLALYKLKTGSRH